MKAIRSLCIALLLVTSLCFVESTDLGVDPSGHFITKDEKPIFLLGDTIWPLAARFKDGQVRAYLDNTKELGFNVIGLFETTPWAAFDKQGKNLFGDHPYCNSNPWQLNDKYWRRYEFVIREAGKRGIYVYLCVGGPLRPKIVWKPLDTPQKAYDYGNARSYAWIYSTNGRNFAVNMSRLKGKAIAAQWYDPRTGKFQKLGTYKANARQQFDPPGKAGPGNDWVLVLDSMNGAAAAPSQDGSGPPAGANWKLTFSGVRLDSLV